MTQEQAFTLLKTGANVFLTGEPGSGKTHMVNQYVSYLHSYGIAPAITASTGIAATHIGGMTIHSWSGIGIRRELDAYDLNKLANNKYVTKRIKRAKVLIIDEISMLAGSTLDMVEAVCRNVLDKTKPFGGLQVIFVGDFFQLPPVVRDEEEFQFAFQSSAWATADLTVCYLTEQHRQDDSRFLAVLGAMRDNAINDEHVQHLESRLISPGSMPDDITKLFAHNSDVDQVNGEKLARLPGKNVMLLMSSRGFGPMVESLKKSCLSPERLELKIGARVMFTKNNPNEGFVNGTLGEVTGFSHETNYPIVRTNDGMSIVATPMEWTIEDAGSIKARIEQVPLRLAWAITIHKSQGMSLDEAIVDLSAAFEFGQGYVALSRVRRLSGLYLLGYNQQSLLVHPSILTEDQHFRVQSTNAEKELALCAEEKLEQQFQDFIARCGGGVGSMTSQGQQQRKTSKKAHTPTQEVTLVLLNADKNIIEIAHERGLSSGTIVAHIEYLMMKGKINRDIVAPLLSKDLSDELSQIHATFRESNDGKLAPVFKKYGGKYSYDELRLARMLLE